MTPIAHRSLEKAGPPRSLKILVADDVVEIVELVRHWLQAAGHTVTAAGDGREVLERVQKETFDILVVDIVMPGIDGWDVILAVGRVRPEMRILAISGGGKSTPVEAGLRMAKGLGADLVLKKPFRQADFLAAIGKLAARLPPA